MPDLLVSVVVWWLSGAPTSTVLPLLSIFPAHCYLALFIGHSSQCFFSFNKSSIFYHIELYTYSSQISPAVLV